MYTAALRKGGYNFYLSLCSVQHDGAKQICRKQRFLHTTAEEKKTNPAYNMAFWFTGGFRFLRDTHEHKHRWKIVCEKWAPRRKNKTLFILIDCAHRLIFIFWILCCSRCGGCVYCRICNFRKVDATLCDNKVKVIQREERGNEAETYRIKIWMRHQQKHRAFMFLN